MPDPKDLPLLQDWNDLKLAQAVKFSDHAPSGVQCPQSVSELLDVPGTQSSAKVGELLVTTVMVTCPDCGFKGERYL